MVPCLMAAWQRIAAAGGGGLGGSGDVQGSANEGTLASACFNMPSLGI